MGDLYRQQEIEDGAPNAAAIFTDLSKKITYFWADFGLNFC